MHQYYYVNSMGNGQQYYHQRSDRVYPTDRKSTVEIEYFDLAEPPFNWISPVDQKVVAKQESFYSWTTPADNYGKAPQGQFNPWAQPLSHKGMTKQGHYQGLAPLAIPSGVNPQNSVVNQGFNPPKQPPPWVKPVNHTGMFPQGNPAANPFGFGPNGQQANLGSFGNPAGWTGQVNPMGWGGPGSLMGWGNNGANGRPGIFGNLLNLGKGTMNGIGIITSLIGMGKLF